MIENFNDLLSKLKIKKGDKTLEGFTVKQVDYKTAIIKKDKNIKILFYPIKISRLNTALESLRKDEEYGY